ncbi:uracil-DNA glycosylase family protein [Moraxella pluranimalium]|uniref:DNA glycosylase n=1 Tax=Moraxella pluranimalium TaxID=470453 RepID=A0A1T0CVA8_9GAMM|nr:uracil-DNA glycosylase family protein [Moraxella pluranimalium]OOS26252.1 DNA glycosylase [Moraxella pluranimalium]
MTIETHPLSPFTPPNSQVLILGSFPPPQVRWKMDFYYPNFNNDFWRIMGLVFFDNKDEFINTADKSFYQDKIERFLTDTGIAISDTAYQIKRLQNNASDKFLEVITPMDIGEILDKLPNCTSIITTGEKATQILCDGYLNPNQALPKVGQSVELMINDKAITLYRLPSSSRAYPMSLEKKAMAYRQVLGRLALESDGA